MSDAWIDLGPLSAFPEGAPALRKAAGGRFACIRRGDTVHALDDVCPHQGYPLSQGTLRDGVLTCEWHNWKFEVATGRCSFGGEDVRRYPTRLENGRVQLLRDVDPVAEGERLAASIRGGLSDNEVGRVVRDGLRLGALRSHALGVAGPALELVAEDAAARARYGFDHTQALLADLCSWTARSWLDGSEALALAATSAGEEEQARPPRPRHEGAYAGRSVLDDLVNERRTEAEAGVRALVRSGGAPAAREALLPFVARHLYDYGHGAIFLSKAQELATRFPDAAEDVMASVTVALAWATADTVTPPFASTRAALASLAETPARSSASAFDRPAFEEEVLAGERRGVEACAARLREGCAPRDLLRAVAHAAAVRLTRFDDGWQRRLDSEVGVLDVTHAVTFAEAALALTEGVEDEAPARRLAVIAAGFVGKLRAADGPPPSPTGSGDLLSAARKRDLPAALGAVAALDAPARREAYRLLAPFAALDAAVRPIHFAHTVKMTEALARLEGDDPGRDDAYLRALVTYIVPRRPERNVRRLAAVARKFLEDGRPPHGLF